jgi:hypothetical protein
MTSHELTKLADFTRHDRGTGALRTRRPEYVDFLPPCNDACPAGENIQAWLALAQDGDHEGACRELIELRWQTCEHMGLQDPAKFQPS